MHYLVKSFDQIKLCFIKIKLKIIIEKMYD